MAGQSPVVVGIALALICVTGYGQANDNCRTGCRGASHTFKYHEGTTYKYNFDSKIQVSLSTAEGQHSVTEVKATVLLTQQPQCNQVLKLQNVQIISSDGKKHANLPDVDKPIRINYHDGHLEDSICVTPGDTQNSLNLKRAIASIFQANLKSGHETDVFGLCQTDVSSHKEGNVLVIEKSRNLNRCNYRENIKQQFLATAYNLNSEIKSSPILNGDYDAKLRVKNGILEQATVHEQYLFVPFSVGNNGAKASVETTLKYVGSAKDNSQVKQGQPRSIIFEDPHPVNSPHANVNNILAAVKEVTKTIDITVGEHTAKAYANLIRILQVSKKDDLLAVYNQVRAGVGFPDKVAAKKIFLDALLRAQNGDNIDVVIELLRNKELNPIEENLVYLGLSSVRHATESSLNSAVILLSQANLPPTAYLGIGNLAGSFCRQHSCDNVKAVNELTQKLIQKLGSGKPSTKREENEVVYVLKSLGNFHHLNDNILAKLTAIAQDKKVANRVRVTALETYLGDPCKDKLRDSALSILKDIQQDSEVRIKAFLAAAQCPNNKVSNAVKALLETEPSYQVGGFIVTYIRNLKASANPDKELAKQHLGFINLPKRFPLDLRKYSANGEFSYTIDTLGLANSIESNVIYSQNSFLPRSASLNLTADVFGHSFNFLEIETRQENLDRLIEHYLGPRGILRSSSLQELWDSKGKKAEKIISELLEKVQTTLRTRRDVTKAEIDHINKQVQIKTNELNRDLDLDLSVRSFGSEVLFLNVNDDVNVFTPEAIIEKIVGGLSNGLDKLKHFDETLRSNLLFLDSEFVYPTSSGFPLKLGVEGTSNVQLKASGSIDVRALLRDEGTIKVSLIPSANVVVAGRLTVDTLLVESGLKVISTLHTKAGGDLSVELLKKSIDVKYSLPVKENLLSATHDIVFHTREWGTHEVNAPLKFEQNRDFSISFDQLNDFIGLTFGAEFTGPNLQGEKVPILPFPLSGDAKIAVSIEREDDSSYHYREVLYDDSNKIGAEVTLAALGKNGQKKSSLEIKAFLLPEKVIRAAFVSPIASASLEGRITTTATEKSISLRFVQDKNEYFGKVGVAVQGSPARSVYKPIFINQEKLGGSNQFEDIVPYKVEGQLIVEDKGPTSTYIFDNVRFISPDQKAITVNGKLGTEPETVFADVTVSDGSSSGSFQGKLRVNPNLIKYNAEVKNSVNPTGNIRLKGELSRSVEEIKNFFQVAHGGDFSNKGNILTLENSWKYRNRGPQDFVLETKNRLTYPGLATDLKFEFELKPQTFQYDLDIQYTDFKLGSELEWEHNAKRDGVDFELEFGIWGLNNRLNLKSKRKVAGEQSQLENSLEVNGERVEVNGKVKHHIKPQDVDVAADLIIKLPAHSTPFHVVSGLRFNPNEIDASHKVSSGNVVFIDLFFKANKAGNANGSIKVNLKDNLVIKGQVRANKGTGNGEIVFELPAVGRTSKIDTDFAIHDPKYNIVVNIYPIFNEDKSKKITLSTQTTLTQHSIDSKNFINAFGNKLEGNVKGTEQGDGRVNGDLEVTLPNNHYLAAKLNRDIRNVNNVYNGNGILSLEYRTNKNQPGNKVTLKGQLKNTKPEENIYDVNYQLSAESSTGRNLNVDLKVRRQQKGDLSNLEIANKIYGSELSSPIETVLKSNCKIVSATYDIKSSYAPLGNLVIGAKYDVEGSGKPISGEIDVDLKVISPTLTNAKFSASGSVLKTDSVVVQGQVNVYADGPKGVIIKLAQTGEVKSSDKEVRVKGSLNSANVNPISIDAGIKRDSSKNEKEIGGDIAIEYGKNQKIKGDFDLIRLEPHEYKLDIKLDTPVEGFKNNRLQVHSKNNEDRTHYQSEVIYTSDGKTWTTDSDLLLSETTPSIDIKVKCPEGKLRQLLVKITKLSEHQLAGQLKVVNQKKNFLLEGTVDANTEKIDNFHIKITANSPALKIDKYVIEAQNRPAKTGRRIQVTAKSGNKNILAGSTSYTAREEQGKLIIEGSGSFKVHDQTQSANFKYIRQNLNQAQNGETGIEISFDAGLGSKAIDAELKVTNKQFRILNSYCEEKKQCAHVEIDVKTSADDVNYFNQEIEVTVDLRKLGLSHEFGLKAVTERKEYVLDHTVDVHFQSHDNSKYQYSLYVHPKKAGISLTTPKRIVSLEANVNVPPNLLKDGGRISGEFVLYTDKKNQPNKKSGVVAFLDVKSQSVVGEARFTNPGLRRPLVVSLQLKAAPGLLDSVVVVDVFNQPDQKITIDYKQHWSDLKNWKKQELYNTIAIKSSGLGIDILLDDYALFSFEDHHYKISEKLTYAGAKSKYETLVLYEATPRNIQSVIKVLNLEILKINSQLQSSQNQQIVDTELSCYGHKPFISHLEVKNLNSFKYTLARKDKPNDKLQINSAFIPGQIADFRAEVVKNGAPHELGYATVKLDDANFLKSDYKVLSNNIKELLLKPINNVIQEEEQAMKQISDELIKNIGNELRHLGEVGKRATPDFTPLRQYYSSELNKIKEEILADKTIKEASELLYNILSAISQAFGETFAHFSELVESIARSFQNSFGKVIETIDRDILPNVKEIVDKFLRATVEMIDLATNVVLTISLKVAEIAETYRPELQQLATTLGKASEGVLKALVNVLETIKSVIVEEWQRIYKEIQALPAFEQIKSEYERLIAHGLPTSEAITNTVKELLVTLKEITPTAELKELIQAITDYVVSKLSNQQINDEEAINRIIKAAVVSAKSVYVIIFEESTSADLQNVKVPVPTSLWNKLPKLAAVRFSPLSYILGEDVELSSEFLLSLVNAPRNWVPPFPLYGIVAQGQHIFTFDGKHLTFPGKCNYVLAHDAVDGNFTVTGSYNNGLLTAISLTQGSDTITLKNHGQVLVNNAASEFPARKPNVAAFRDNEKVTLISAYGVQVVCGPELVGCAVSVSGFYHGKLRGLLGNGNNEPYDDFTLPSGKIVTSESEFGNSYKTTSGCAAVQTVSHEKHHATPECDKLFGWESSLRYCYPFVKTDNFRTACEHGIAAGVKDTVKAIAVAYVAACNQHNIPVRVPSEFAKCTNGDKPASLGDQFSVKTPGKAADIVLLIDTVQGNEPVYKEYIQPLVQQLTSELNSKGISDVEFHIIAYGGENQWPTHITSAGGKTTFKGKAPNVKFSENPPEDRLVSDIPNLDAIVQLLRELGTDIKLAFGLDLQAWTYNEGLGYPFRAHAIKSIIAVTSKSCEIGRLYPLQVLRTILYRGKDVNLNLITPVGRRTNKGEAKNIVGFNAVNVFGLGSIKNKIKHFADLSKELPYDDYCIDFTVQNEGNVFASDHILLQPKNVRKQFVQVTSHGIVDQLLGTEKNYDCECKFISPFSASNVCKLVSSQAKPQARKVGTKS